MEHRPPAPAAIGRRGLLTGTVLSAGALAAPTGAGAAAGRDPVVVVGAGMAGITAARALTRAGVPVRVVEARPRIGGRIHTVRDWPGVPLDLGASWIHGYDGNPLTPIAERAGAPMVRTSYSSGRVHVDPGLRDAGLDRPDTQRWAALVRRALRTAWRRDRDSSLAAAVRRETRDLDLSRVERADLAFYLNATYVTEWGADPAELSAFHVDDGREFGPTGEDVLFPHGFDRVVEHLARGLRPTLGVRVRRVVLRRRGVDVHTSAGRLRASAVVVTVPLGVLRAGSIDVEPGLPEPMTRAIEALRMGVLSKTFLRFDRPFWPERFDWQEYVGPRHGAWGEWLSLRKTGAPVLLTLRSEDPLPPDRRQKLRRMKADLDLEFRALIRQAIAEGSILPCDPKVAAFTVAGALSWVGRWYRPDGGLAPADIATQCIAVLTRGLCSPSYLASIDGPE